MVGRRVLCAALLLSLLFNFLLLPKSTELLSVTDLNVYVNYVSEQLATTTTTTETLSTVDNNKNDGTSSTTDSIRKWGCNRNETPFIFVHIGKAGGGGVRARMAASALQYNRSKWQDYHGDRTYYYPVFDYNGTMHKGHFGSSFHNSFLPKSFDMYTMDFNFEKFRPCAATTPLGHMIACPMKSSHCVRKRKHDNDMSSAARCDLVYAGHNMLGNELHWLPTPYLINWWKTTPWSTTGKTTKAVGNDDDQQDHILQAIQDRKKPMNSKFTIGSNGQRDLHKQHSANVRIQRAQPGSPNKLTTGDCQAGSYSYRMYRKSYENCIRPKEDMIDQIAKKVVLGGGDNDGTSRSNNSNNVEQWSAVYASMPVLRVTVIREPFSWLTSKLFWHHFSISVNGSAVSPSQGDASDRNKRRISNIRKDLRQYDRFKNVTSTRFVRCDDVVEAAEGWANNRAILYILYLCGEHCLGGYAAGTMSIADLEQQAAYNLRHSFAVVGLLHKSDEFYDMVSRRVSYMNTALNPKVKGSSHSSGNGEEMIRCKAVYEDETFQNRLMQLSPAIAAINRLYQVAVEVNAFQKQELDQCSWHPNPPEGKKIKSKKTKGKLEGYKDQARAPDTQSKLKEQRKRIEEPVSEKQSKKRTKKKRKQKGPRH